MLDHQTEYMIFQMVFIQFRYGSMEKRKKQKKQKIFENNVTQLVGTCAINKAIIFGSQDHG